MIKAGARWIDPQAAKFSERNFGSWKNLEAAWPIQRLRPFVYQINDVSTFIPSSSAQYFSHILLKSDHLLITHLFSQYFLGISSIVHPTFISSFTSPTDIKSF